MNPQQTLIELRRARVILALIQIASHIEAGKLDKIFAECTTEELEQVGLLLGEKKIGVSKKMKPKSASIEDITRSLNQLNEEWGRVVRNHKNRN